MCASKVSFLEVHVYVRNQPHYRTITHKCNLDYQFSWTSHEDLRSDTTPHVRLRAKCPAPKTEASVPPHQATTHSVQQKTVDYLYERSPKTTVPFTCTQIMNTKGFHRGLTFPPFRTPRLRSSAPCSSFAAPRVIF